MIERATMPLLPNEDPREELVEADWLIEWTVGRIPVVPAYAWYRLARAAVLALIRLGRERF
jgi:hypothetical protein